MEGSDQNLNSEIFSKLVKNLPGITASHKEDLDKLTAKYPYSQIISALRCKTVTQNPEGFNQCITHAATLFPGRANLHQVIYQPEELVPLAGDFSIAKKENAGNAFQEGHENFVSGYLVDDGFETSVLEPEAEVTESGTPEDPSIALDKDILPDPGLPAENAGYDLSNPETENELESRFDVLSTENHQGEAETRPNQQEEKETQEIFDNEAVIEEIHDISEIDIPSHEPSPVLEIDIETPVNSAEQEMEVYDNVPPATEVTGTKSIEVVESNYFALNTDIETAISHLEEPSANIPEASHPEIQTAITKNEPAGAVSNYNDTKLPYTFLWWLDKTRREHSNLYQPYAGSPTTTSRPDFTPVQQPPGSSLDQQIIEHVFHLQSPLDDIPTKSPGTPFKTIQFKLGRKEDDLIERFIKEEPQIRPLRAEQINNENKARNSAMDTNDLVSETLANIYIEQMLFHKAIETYRKLSLKFPDKKLYFADQIAELEKKIN